MDRWTWLQLGLSGLVALAVWGLILPVYPGAPPEHFRLPASSFALVEGRGQQADATWQITDYGPRGAAILAMRLGEDNQTGSFEHLAIEFASEPPYPDTMLIWSEAGAPAPTHRQTLDDPVAGIHLDTLEGWPEQLGILGLVLSGPDLVGSRVQALTLRQREPGLVEFYQRLFDEWLSFEGWTQYSINLILGGEQRPELSLNLVVSFWAGTTLLLLLVYRRVRRQSFPRPALLITLVSAWLLVDSRWQLDLSRQLEDTRKQYIGKASEEKIFPVAGGPALLDLVDQIKNLLAPEARVFIVAEHDLHGSYTRYRLLPLSAHYHKAYRGDFSPRFSRFLRSGDGVLLLGRGNTKPNYISGRMTTDWIERLPLHFAPQELRHDPDTLIEDEDSPTGTALVANPEDGTQLLHRGPYHEAPPLGYYQAIFTLRSDNTKPVRARLIVRQRLTGSDKVVILADRFVHLSEAGYRDYSLPFVITQDGPIEYLLRVPDRIRSAGVRLDIMNNSSNLAFLDREGEPPYVVVRRAAATRNLNFLDIGILFEVL